MSLAEQISNVTKGKVTLAQVQKIFKNDERRMQHYLKKVENRQMIIISDRFGLKRFNVGGSTV